MIQFTLDKKGEILIYFIWLCIIFLFIFIIFTTIQFVEYFYCIFVKKQVPLVASCKKLRRFTVNEIQKHYPDSKNIIELGSGFGGLTRYLARKTNKKVTGIENIAWYAFVSKILDIFCFKKNSTVHGDAFEYLEKTKEHFDIAIAYLGPRATQKIPEYKDKIDMFISLDFPVLNLKPTRTIDIGYGATIIGNKKYPHKLYIYEFKHK